MKLETILHHIIQRLKPNYPRVLVFECPPGDPTAVSSYMLMTSSSGSGSGERRTVQVGRRRKVSQPGPEGRERAEAPQREKPETSAAPPSYGGTGYSGGVGGSGGAGGTGFPFPSGGQLKGSPKLIGIIALVVVVACILCVTQLTGTDLGTGVTFEQPALTEEPFQPALEDTPTRPVRNTATRPPRPAPTQAVQGSPVAPANTAVAAPAVQPGQKWLVMLYQDADDKILEQDIYVDLNEAERVGSSERVQIVAQVDRFRGAYSGDGDWTSTKRFYITQDDDLRQVSSRQMDDIGEANMADGGSLVDFVTWAMDSYPADKYVLILSDHGMGWPGGWSDPAPGGSGDPRIPLASRLGDHLFLNELEQALQQIRSETGLDKFELIGMDACLMGQVEVFSALAPHARYAVASEEVEPSLGWAYTGFLQSLSENPDISGAELGRLIVESYIQEDQRIVDDQARAEFLRQGAPMGGLFGMMGDVPAAQLARQIGQEITLTAVDLSVMPELLNGLNELAFKLQQADQSQVASARTYSQSFTSIFGTQVPPSYIDLGHFVQLVVRQAGTAQIEGAAERLLGAMDQAILAEKHGPKKPGATGFTVFFPNSQLYRNPVTGAESYTAIAQRFAKDSLWDDFLLYHYTGIQFEPQAEQAVIPSAGTAVRAPGLGQVQISPIRLSIQVAAPGRPVTLSADIDGENIGYIYLMVGYYDRAANSIFLADTDYLESSDTRELNGVYYPDWGEGGFTMEFEWEPVVFAISDGDKRVTALFKPQSYGATFEEAIYSVDGIYTFAESGESLNARLNFNNGQLLTVYGITGEGETGAPRQITPQNGDTFTVIEKWLDLDSSGKVTQTVSQDGGVLTFGLGGLEWMDLDAAPGEYIVGFIVEDLDGNRTEAYTQVTVE